MTVILSRATEVTGTANGWVERRFTGPLKIEIKE